MQSLVTVPKARASITKAPSVASPRFDIVLDLSRLLSRVLHATPTGVDRVELAYARGLLQRMPQGIIFSVTHPSGLYGRPPRSAAVDFISLTAERWETGDTSDTRARRWWHAARACLAVAPWPRVSEPRSRPAAYLHISPRSLERARMVRAVLQREQARLIPFVHDLIPITHPEYARPQSTILFQRKLRTILTLADGVIVNSHATAATLAPHLEATGRKVPIQVAPLGVDARLSKFGRSPLHGVAPSAGHPYFVTLGTIEPRKNHLLLLHIWRRLIETLGPNATPRLVVIGRRGWENEMVLDLLERCTALRPVVEEHQGLSDARQREILSGAQALLMPSFVEGYGLPVAEALVLGVPVIASDLPALREVGAAAADYIDPLDVVAWSRAILDYNQPVSARRSAQLERLKRWRRPSWEAHLDTALGFIDQVVT